MSLMWLVLSVGLVLAPFVFAYAAIFSRGSSMINFLVVVMLLVFAMGLLAPVAKYNKVRKNNLYLIGVAAAILLPVVFALTNVFPLLHSDTYSFLFLLMHFVVASGFILAYSHRASIKKIF
jgi:hypothetical protein